LAAAGFAADFLAAGLAGLDFALAVLLAAAGGAGMEPGPVLLGAGDVHIFNFSSWDASRFSICCSKVRVCMGFTSILSAPSASQSSSDKG
jgi:hypothetical protein